MIIAEHYVQVYEDEKKEKLVQVRSFEISGVPLAQEKNLPVTIRITGCPPIYLNCSHQGADIFIAFPISVWSYIKLKWHKLTTPIKNDAKDH